MKGEVSIVIHDSKIRYEFTIRRNITVIRGCGGTGKTTLYDMVRLSSQRSTGVKKTVSTSARLITLSPDGWDIALAGLQDSNVIFFLDESCTFMKTKEFARAAKESGCYFVLITRDNLAGLPCSIHEVYQLKTTGHKITFQSLFPDVRYGEIFDTQLFIVEDSNSGFDFIKAAFPSSSVVSAKGKDNLCELVQDISKAHPVVLADGAALGFIIAELLAKLNKQNGVLIAEESFEYIILTSSIFSGYHTELQGAIENIDALDFFSWERFFTAYLCEITKDTVFAYKKKSLNKIYLLPKNAEKIVDRYQLKAKAEQKTSVFKNEG